MPKAIRFHTGEGDHPDPDIMAAFADKALNEDERAAFFAHLAECERCREGLRLHARLKGFTGSEAKPPCRISGWPAVPYFGTAAGLACAAIGIALILLLGHGPDKQIADSSRRGNPLLAGQQLAAQNPLLLHGQNDSGAQAKLQNNRPRPLTARRQQPVRYGLPSNLKHSPEQSHSPDVLWGTIRFRTLEFGPDRRSALDLSMLPGAFASARLELQTTFRAASLEIPGEEEEVNRASINKQIAVKTILGERRIYLSIPGAESITIQ